ncbi:YhgE/Pip domain-containing protein [Ornithinibacillus halotolerans]|uniref:YhgE/Pip domain-containing protein n=1 Tax=Ornithinibacillus halotolerans TaxID=1274357 RepID=A0A916RV43_9BACI|nr:YhgE/Pip domain-containing protein [Ornithinibacillus halotolerans]GGA71961.1 hypothetical protein GCM10008025_14730 [Ornithinibacillus halotolerans]
MRRFKKIIIILLALLLILPSFLTTASNNDSTEEDTDPTKEGKFSSKDEVVYATLSATGESKEIYIVNSFEIEEEGKIIDYGTYSNLKNLTNLSEIVQDDNQVEFIASKGEFYYQGNLNNKDLPWDISVSYYLNGEEITPDELAGMNGHVEIRIKTRVNEQVDPVFFENYLLQISVPLDSDIFSEIQAQDGLIANAGKNKQVTFTVMPEQEEEFIVEAKAVNFELAGIDITGIPSSMPIESPDVDEMTNEMKTLSKAISELNDGVADFKSGVTELNVGVAALRDGSSQFNDGVNKLNDSSPDVVNGSKEIELALESISTSLQDLPDIDTEGMNELVSGLNSTASGLGEIITQLESLKQNVKEAYENLDTAIANIPSYELSTKEMEDLRNSTANNETVEKLIDMYNAAKEVKSVYTNVKPTFEAMDMTMQGVINALSEMQIGLNTMAEETAASLEEMNDIGKIVQLQQGLQELASNYTVFHSGLEAFVNGVGQLSNSYQELHEGIVGISDGTNELENGMDDLHKGTTELDEATSDLPNQMTKEIDQMISEYDKSDFEVVSFISNKNKEVGSVQFVLKTESIKIEESTTTEEPTEEKKGFWSRFLDLFK